MDPTSNLGELKSLTHSLISLDQEVHEIDKDALADIVRDAMRMAELFRALDMWIAHGGHLPDQWRHR